MGLIKAKDQAKGCWTIAVMGANGSGKTRLGGTAMDMKEFNKPFIIVGDPGGCKLFARTHPEADMYILDLDTPLDDQFEEIIRLVATLQPNFVMIDSVTYIMHMYYMQMQGTGKKAKAIGQNEWPIMFRAIELFITKLRKRSSVRVLFAIFGEVVEIEEKKDVDGKKVEVKKYEVIVEGKKFPFYMISNFDTYLHMYVDGEGNYRNYYSKCIRDRNDLITEFKNTNFRDIVAEAKKAGSFIIGDATEEAPKA